MDNVLPALVISTLAGMSTAIGSLFAIFSKRSNERFLSFSLGFSAGVMILISFSELLPDARDSLVPALGERLSGMTAGASLLIGMLLAFLIGRFVPSVDDEIIVKPGDKVGEAAILMRTGIVTAIAVTVHNLPEGIATFMAGYSGLKLGLPVAISVALHNIPEGIAVAVPIYYATGSRAKAFWYSALSGLSEPVGALLAFAVLGPFINSSTLGVIFGGVAGIMLFISFDGLIPSSQKYGHTKAAVAGIFLGVIFMQTALTVFGL